MRKTLLTVLCLGTLYASASMVYNGTGETGVMMNQNAASVKATPTKNALSKDERTAISLITSMYNTKGFDDTAYLKKHCTKKLLKVLKAAYDDEYDPLQMLMQAGCSALVLKMDHLMHIRFCVL